LELRQRKGGLVKSWETEILIEAVEHMLATESNLCSWKKTKLDRALSKLQRSSRSMPGGPEEGNSPVRLMVRPYRADPGDDVA